MITRTFQLAVLLTVAVYFYVVLSLLRRRRLNLRYTLLWILCGAVMLLLALFPQLLNVFSALVGVYSPANALFAIVSLFLILLLMSMTVIVSHLNESVKRLTQHSAMLEKRIREMERKTDKNKENRF